MAGHLMLVTVAPKVIFDLLSNLNINAQKPYAKMRTKAE
jgi:hypothetical protein